MSGKSAIEWTDATWNPFRGCRKISPGCKHCYAETFAERWRGVKDHPYERGFDPRFVAGALSAPLSWKKPRRVFVNSMSDLFFEEFENEQIASVFAVMAASPQHTFQVLTKRIARMREWFQWVEKRAEDGKALFPADSREWRIRQMLRVEALRLGTTPRQPVEGPWPLPNVWLGVSAEDQKNADARIPDLLETPAAVRFVSYEPALGPIDFDRITTLGDGTSSVLNTYEDVGAPPGRYPRIDWIIVGGESGHGARPFDIAWALDVIRQCKAQGVACFVKQMGDCAFERAVVAKDGPHAGKIIGGIRLTSPTGTMPSKKGGQWEQWPEALRVRQYPGGSP